MRKQMRPLNRKWNSRTCVARYFTAKPLQPIDSGGHELCVGIPMVLHAVDTVVRFAA